MCVWLMIDGRPWWAVLFGGVEVLLHALVVLDLGGDWDRQWLTMVAIATPIVTSRELAGPANNSEKNRECQGKRLDNPWDGYSECVDTEKFNRFNRNEYTKYFREERFCSP